MKLFDPISGQPKTLGWHSFEASEEPEGPLDLNMRPTKAEVDLGDLSRWYVLQRDLITMRNEELALRKKIAAEVFIEPKEGVNRYYMEDGHVVECSHKITRKLDEAMFAALQNDLIALSVNVNSLIKWTPELSIAAYRELNDEQRLMVDRCLIIGDGTPSLDIVKPKVNPRGFL